MRHACNHINDNSYWRIWKNEQFVFGECSALIKERDHFLMRNRYILIKKNEILACT
jgi:hypothetical protein